MPSPEIEEFARILVQQVRDAAIQNSDRCLRPDVTHVVAQRWRAAAVDGKLENIASVLIPDIVDKTVAQVLRAIDDGLLQVSFTALNGKKVDLPKEGLGELTGWYMGSDGWRAMYSRERFVDDFSDLK